MKTLKYAFVAVTVCFSTLAHAEDYKWVSLTKNQEDVLAKSCEYVAANSAVPKALTGGVVSSVGAFIGLTFPEAEIAATTTGGSGIAAIVSVGAAVYQYFFKKQELMALVYEFQTGRPGLMTQKLEQISAENGYDKKKMIAVLNTIAVRGQACEDDREIKDLAVGQQKTNSALLNEEALLKKQQAEIAKQLESK